MPRPRAHLTRYHDSGRSPPLVEGGAAEQYFDAYLSTVSGYADPRVDWPLPPPPTVALTKSDLHILAFLPNVKLTWSSTDATACRGSGAWRGSPVLRTAAAGTIFLLGFTQLWADRHRALSWAQRFKRVFEIETCEQCGGKVRVMASIEDATEIGQIPGHLASRAGPAVTDESERPLRSPGSRLIIQIQPLPE